ncbi:hypothetical protein SLEP1_g37471 [Rubroshorea leprosula]|uniref:BED-type domain-containing protein n=1 Tax=Rubroshorea leprosula TaxID=152421 RepID=A0AAV5KUP3_9ROSI|nr:hypothetical protein SLEP1_g37471 [Rubroshorea leprosula]
MASHLEQLPITPLKQDPAWKHVQMFRHGDRVQLKCIYCEKVFKGGGIHRIKEHLAKQKGNAATCLCVPPDVRDLMQQSLNGAVSKRRKKDKIVEEIMNVNLIPREVDPFDNECDADTGVQFIGAPHTLEPSPNLLLNGAGTSGGATGDNRRKRGKEKSFANADSLAHGNNGLGAKQVNNHLHAAIGKFLFDIGAPMDAVNSIFFQPMVDAIVSVGSESLLPSQNDIRGWVLKNSVEEVKANVDKIAAAWGKTGCSVLADTFPSLYWTPCAVCCLDMILRDFAKIGWINAIIEQARSITRFMYNHSVVLNMMRRYTSGVDVVESAVTRSATNFTTLKRIVDLKHNLQSMVTSQEWVDSPYSKKPAGLEMLDIVSNQSFWSSCALITRLTIPLLQLLRIVGNKKQPAMGYVYAGMYRAKEAIKRELNKRENYLTYWNIIDHWWQQQWQHPLYAAGFYLNPKFFYSFEGDLPNEILSGMFDCIERLVPETIVQDKIVKEMNCSYKSGAGDFGRKMAIRAREIMLPAEWWLTYGGSCPNLARLAIRVLSQTCCSLGLNLNRSSSGQLYDVRNSLEHQRLKDLVFVQYNLRLKQIGYEEKIEDSVDPLSIDANSLVEDWVREDTCLGDCSNSDWMALDSHAVNTMSLGSPVDGIDELGAVFDDYEVLKRVKDED